VIYTIQVTSQFKKDCKKMKKRGHDLQALEDILDKLVVGEKLPEKNHDHDLVGDYRGFRECHILPDWLLIYYIQSERLVLVCSRTGSHSDLF